MVVDDSAKVYGVYQSEASALDEVGRLKADRNFPDVIWAVKMVISDMTVWVMQHEVEVCRHDDKSVMANELHSIYVSKDYAEERIKKYRKDYRLKTFELEEVKVYG